MEWNKYFEEDPNVYLSQIHFQKAEVVSLPEQQMSVEILDNLMVEENEDNLIIVVNRKILFIPAIHFELEVEYSAELIYKEGAEIKNVNWEEEFINDEDFVMPQIIAKVSLEFGRITGEVGNMPLITVPQYMQK